LHKLLSINLKDRIAELEQAKRDGFKIVGYFPGNYVPEEIIHASGAVPLCLAQGGTPASLDAAKSVVPDVICPFARTQIGERLLKSNPHYSVIDMLVAPITCQHLRKVAEVWEYDGDLEIFKLGVPHNSGGDFELEYYVDRLRALKERLQVFTGNQITDESINGSIDLYNRMRALLKKISQVRRAPDVPINAREFVRLNHASLYTDPASMVDALDAVYGRILEKQPAVGPSVPRLLLLGPNLGYGDYSVLELVEEAGGEIVIEDLCEGLRYYWQAVEDKGDPLESLAKAYLRDRIPCAFMHYSAKKRLDFSLQLITDFNVSGVIWYQLLNCETYDAESYFFAQQMKERNIPMLILESGYGESDVGQLKVRIDAFVEILKGGPET